MSASLTPSKRPRDGESTETNGKGKSQNQPSKAYSIGTTFRVLCPSSKTGSVIGKSGSTISRIRQESGAKIKVEEAVPGSDERIIIIVQSDKGNDFHVVKSNDNGNEEAKVDEKQGDKVERSGTGNDNGDEEKEFHPVQCSESENGNSSAQKALMLIFERMVEAEPNPVGGDEENNKSLIFVLRLLVLSTQVGCILGKGGSVIKQMSAESGAQIRILPRDKLPTCATASDELVQITGEVGAVRRALQSVAQQLMDNPPRDHDSFPAGISSHSYGQPLPRQEVGPPPFRSFITKGIPHSDGSQDFGDPHSDAPPLISKFHEGGVPGRVHRPQEILTYRILCHEDRVGSIIGKGGSIIKTVQQETGCEIKIMEGVADSEDRVIVVSGPAHPDDRISPVQDAALRVQTRIIRAVADSQEQGVTARLLISSNQIGCLLGRGGAIIAEMRKLSRAHIRILGKDQIPKCASDDEEVVLINGEFEAVQEALFQITARLQQHFFRDMFPSMNYPPNHPLFDQPFPPFMGRRELSPPGMFSNYGPSFHKFDAVGGLPPRGGFYPHDDHAPFMHNIHRFGGRPHISERRPWGPQGIVGGSGPMGLPEFAGAPQRRIGGGNHSAVITNTTVEVIVPRSVVSSIYGEDGECLKQIRQISDAKITVTEPKSGAIETVIIISGTPEQTHAAQSLIQAFVMCENEST